MTESAPDQLRLRNLFLVVTVLAVTVLFLWMIRSFVVTLVFAGIFSAMSYPLYERLLRLLRNRATLASVSTLMVVVMIVVIPTLGFLGIVVSQAVDVSQAAGPWIQNHANSWPELQERLRTTPLVGTLVPEQEQIVESLSGAVTWIGSFLIDNVASATRGTAVFFLQLFVMLYAMFFFLIDGTKLMERILFLTPLTSDDEDRLLERFVSVTRATLKGSLVVGLIQGGLAGAGFWVFGIGSAAFWGTVMGVLSVIPAVGAGLVWAPAVVFLMIGGRIGAALGLLIWCGAVVGTVDNFLRPRLIGRDTKMSDLLILLSTFGGLSLFGMVGFLLGPIIAALFVTLWDLAGEAFADMLPPTDGGAERAG
jgi:predicted PurR-regulated permease PerM